MWKLLKENATKYGTAAVELAVASNNARKQNHLFTRVDAIVAAAPKRNMSEKMSQISSFAAFKAGAFLFYLGGASALYYFHHFIFVKEQEEELQLDVGRIKNSVTTLSGKSLSEELNDNAMKMDKLHEKLDELHEKLDKLEKVDKLHEKLDKLEKVDKLHERRDQPPKK